MSAQDNQDLRLLFALFDVDNSGSLTKEELKQLLQSPNPDSTVSEQQVADYLKLADTDNSGDISVDEFVAFVTNEVPSGTYGLKSIFRTIDTNGDGSVEKDEFEQTKTNNKDLNQTLVSILDKKFQQDANTKVTFEQLRLLFSLFDTDHDGHITQDEVKHLVQMISGDSWSDEQLTAFMQIVDTDTSGDITIDEFTVMMNQYVPTSTLGLRDLFNTFDLSGDGTIDKQEFDQVMKEKGSELNEDQINIFKKIFEKDENSKVTYEQFIDGATEVYKSLKFN